MQNKTFSQYTRLKRIEAGVTQKAVAEALGVNVSQVSRRESGSTDWCWSELVVFAGLLGKKVSEFVAEFENE